MTNLVDFEKSSNPFLLKLKEDFSKNLQKYNSKNLVIIVPISQTLNFKEISLNFFYTHIFLLNQEKNYWNSINGLIGNFSEKVDFINLLDNSPKKELLIEFKFKTKNSDPISKIPILRKSEIVLQSKKIPFYLISEPIYYENCEWKKVLNLTQLDDIIGIQQTKSSSLFTINEKKILTFQDFVEKMKHKSTIHIVKQIKNFIEQILSQEYQESVPKQVLKYLNETEELIRNHPHWKGAGEKEFENAREGLEKYVMLKLFSKVFSPTIEDIQKDTELSNKLEKLKNLPSKNLDVDPAIENDPKWKEAIDELKKINSIKSPKDKLACITNSFKIVNNIIQRLLKMNPSADNLLPVLIYLVLKSNCPHLHSNVKYIQDFRNPNCLISESGYHLTNLYSCVMFWENVTYQDLNMKKEEFDEILNDHSSSIDSNFSNNIDTNDSSIEDFDKIPNDVYEMIQNFNYKSEFINQSFDNLNIRDLKDIFEEYKKFSHFYQNLKDFTKK